MKRALPVCFLIIGAVALVLSTNWVKLFPPTTIWTDADVAKLEELNGAVLELYYRLPPGKAAELEDPDREPSDPLTPYEKAVNARNSYRAKRDIAMTRPRQIATTLRRAGLAFLAAGAGLFYVFKQ